MNSGGKGKATALWGLAILLTLGLAGGVRGEAVKVQVDPPVVEINSFFQGREITLSGMMPAPREAVAEVQGPVGEEHLMRKGRRGPLWLNVGEITVSHAPSLYVILSSRPDLLMGNSPWGFGALVKQLRLTGLVQDKEKSEFLEHFLRLKQSESLYVALPEGLTVVSAGDPGFQKVTGKFWLPANVRTETYKVRLFSVLEGRTVGQAEADLTVKMVGFPALLLTLANEHSALYGILAVVIAILTGFLMGYLFKGGGGH